MTIALGVVGPLATVKGASFSFLFLDRRELIACSVLRGVGVAKPTCLMGSIAIGKVTYPPLTSFPNRREIIALVVLPIVGGAVAALATPVPATALKGAKAAR